MRRKKNGINTPYYNINDTRIRVGILLMCLFCWIFVYHNSWGYPIFNEIDSAPLWNWLGRYFVFKPVAYLVGFLLMMGGAFIVQKANFELMLTRERSAVPFYFYIFIISTNVVFLPLRSSSIGTFCLVICLLYLFGTYHNPNTATYTFMLGFILAVGSLFWIPLIWFLPFFWYALYRFNSLSFRSFLGSVLGFISLYWCLLGLCVWMNHMDWLVQWFTPLTRIQSFSSINFTPITLAYLSFYALLVLVAFVRRFTNPYENSLRTRRFLAILMSMVVWIFLLNFMYEQETSNFLIMNVTPVTFLASNFFTNTTKSKRGLIFFFVMIVIGFALFAKQIWNF